MKCCCVCQSGNHTPYMCNLCRKLCCAVCAGVVYNDRLAECKLCFKANYKAVCGVCGKTAVTPVQGFRFDDVLICLRLGCEGEVFLVLKTTTNT